MVAFLEQPGEQCLEVGDERGGRALQLDIVVFAGTHFIGVRVRCVRGSEERWWLPLRSAASHAVDPRRAPDFAMSAARVALQVARLRASTSPCQQTRVDVAMVEEQCRDYLAARVLTENKPVRRPGLAAGGTAG
tara:strand:- start:9898 stop:10299 length:402 start_codon:yes stop_codon:yes gene_type:complete